MNVYSKRFAVLLAASMLAPFAAAQAAPCTSAGASAVTLGTTAEVAPGALRVYTINLNAGDGVYVDLSGIVPPKPTASSASEGEDEHDHDHGDAAAPAAPRALKLCNAGGALLAPLAGEVFEKGGSITSTPDGERLRFVADRSGQYVINVASGTEPRELLVRRRQFASGQSPIVSTSLDTPQKGIVSSSAPMVFAFEGAANQWVEFKAKSDKDTVLRLAGPDRAGNYSQIAENDDSDGLNPMIRRKLGQAGTYYLQVDSLAEEPGEFELTMKRIAAPKPPPPPAALRLGSQVAGKLADQEDARFYTLPVVAGHSYRLTLTAAYDGVVGIGMANPIEPEDGNEANANFAEIKSQDSGTEGAENLNFTARSNGTIMVRIKSFGIGETDGGYTLIATDTTG